MKPDRTHPKSEAAGGEGCQFWSHSRAAQDGQVGGGSQRPCEGVTPARELVHEGSDTYLRRSHLTGADTHIVLPRGRQFGKEWCACQFGQSATHLCRIVVVGVKRRVSVHRVTTG